MNGTAPLSTPHEPLGRYALPLAGAAIFALLAGLGVLLAGWSLSPAWALPLFGLAIVLTWYCPGSALLHLLRLAGLPTLDRTALALLAGMAISTSVYGLGQSFAAGWLLGVLVAASVGLEARRLAGTGLRRPSRAQAGSALLVLALVCLPLIKMALPGVGFRAYSFTPDGGFAFPLTPLDVLFHLALAQELTHANAPQVPFLAGIPLHYHYAMDLQAAMFANLLGISPVDLTVRFLPALLTSLLALVSFCLGRQWLRSQRWGALVALLVLLGDDLSFVPYLAGTLLAPEVGWSPYFFSLSTAGMTAAVFAINPMLPALCLLLGGLLATMHYLERSERRWLVPAGLLFAALSQYKVFTWAQVLAALGLAAALLWVWGRDRRLLGLWGVTCLLSLPWLWPSYSWFAEGGANTFALSWHAWPRFPAEGQLGQFVGLMLGAEAGSWFASGVGNIEAARLALWGLVPVYLVGALGTATVGVPALLRNLYRSGEREPMRVFAAIFAVLGPLLTLTWTVTPQGYDAEGQFNNSAWFLLGAEFVLWLPAVEGLRSLVRRTRPSNQRIRVGIFVALSMLSTLLLLMGILRHSTPPLAPGAAEAVAFLQRACTAGEPVLSSQEMALPIVTLTRCRVPIAVNVFETSFARPEERQRRLAQRDGFWAQWREGHLDEGTLREYGVAYLVIENSNPGYWARPSSPAGPNDTATPLRSVFRNEQYTVMAVDLP
ncbi:MAG: hypothetical protein ACYC4L_13965 [Chloroflexota bacterium]